MKKFLICALFMVFTLSINAFSQIKVGVGIGINPAVIADQGDLFLPIGLGNFYIPVLFGENFKIEPEFGFMSYSHEDTDTADNNQQYTNSFLRYGIGGFYVMKPAKNFNSYFGLRLGMLSQTSEDTKDPLIQDYDRNETETQSAFYMGLGIGGEYFLSEFFSLGAELQINYISFGEPEATVEYKDQPAVDINHYKDYSKTYFSNNGMIFARFYFN